jgi:competence protein ComEA
MWPSLFIRIGMVALTMGVIFWIGWTVPQVREAEDEPTGQRSGDASGSDTAIVPAVAGDIPPAQIAVAPPAKPRRSERLDLNRATEQDLEALPGIGPVLAERVVEYRQTSGPFRRVEDLRAVKGIGKKKFDRIRSLVSVTPVRVSVREGKKTT